MLQQSSKPPPDQRNLYRIVNGSIVYINGYKYYLVNADGPSAVANIASWATQSDVATDGNRSLHRFESRFNDLSIIDGWAHNAPRAEYSGAIDKIYANNSPCWISFSRLIVGTSNLAGYLRTFQFHETVLPQGNLYDVEPIYHETDTNWNLKHWLAYSTENPIVHLPTTVSAGTEAITPDVWENIVININMDPGGGGYYKVWKNGSQIINYSGAIGYYVMSGYYFRFGVYRRNQNNADPSSIGTAAVWIANVECGPTDLSARVASPLPTPSGTFT